MKKYLSDLQQVFMYNAAAVENILLKSGIKDQGYFSLYTYSCYIATCSINPAARIAIEFQPLFSQAVQPFTG